MRYKIIAEAESSIFISKNVLVESQEVTVEFLRNNEGKLIYISVSKSVSNDKLNNFRQSFEPGTDDARLKISIGGDNEIHNELIKELQLSIR